MNNPKSGPKLPGDDDSWESLATNLFGIDFSKPAISEDDEISFDLTPVTAESKGKDSRSHQDVPPDEDVRLTESPKSTEEEMEAGFPEDDELEAGFPEDLDEDEEVGFPEEDEEIETEIVSVSVYAKTVPSNTEADEEDDDEDFGNFAEEDLSAEENVEEDEEEEEEDTYWDNLNAFEWDGDDEPVEADEPDSAEASQAEASPRKNRDRRKKSGPQKSPKVERTIADEEIVSAADYYNEYEEGDFGSGLLEDLESNTAERRLEEAETAEAESDDEEVSPERKRRRRRRRRKPRSERAEETASRESESADEETEEEDLISLDDMDFESLTDDAEKEPAPPKKTAEVKTRPESRRKGRKVEEDEDPFTTGLDEAEDEEDEKPHRRKRRPHREEAAPVDEETPAKSERRRKDRKSEEDSPYRNIPTWEEAISYLVQPKRSRSNSPSSKSDSDSHRSSGKRRRRRS